MNKKRARLHIAAKLLFITVHIGQWVDFIFLHIYIYIQENEKNAHLWNSGDSKFDFSLYLLCGKFFMLIVIPASNFIVERRQKLFRGTKKQKEFCFNILRS